MLFEFVSCFSFLWSSSTNVCREWSDICCVFFEFAQQVIYHNYVAYNFFEQSIFILSYWIGYADSITIVVMNAFFWHYSYQKYVYRDPEGCFEIAYLSRCLQPDWDLISQQVSAAWLIYSAQIWQEICKTPNLSWRAPAEPLISAYKWGG